MKSIALMLGTFAVLALLGGFFTINPIWLYGPFEGWKIASPAQPDWYVGWLDGSLRLGPALALHFFGHTIPPLFWSGILLPLIMFAGLFAWPFLEKQITGDDREHNICQMPYDAPWRLGLGVAVITFGAVLGFAGSDDIQARMLHIDVESLMYFYRFWLILAPPVLGALAVRIGFELRARFYSEPGRNEMHRKEFIRNTSGGFDEEPLPTPGE